jgi:hypothetical protein
MTLDLLVGGELPPDVARALAAGTSGPCPLTVHRPGNRLGLEVGSVVRFTPTAPPYGRTPTPTTPALPGATTAATAATATVAIDTAVTAFIYLGPHVDSAGNLIGAGCRFTGRGVVPNASEWLVQLPDGTSLTHRSGSRPEQVFGATFGSG